MKEDINYIKIKRKKHFYYGRTKPAYLPSLKKAIARICEEIRRTAEEFRID